MAAVEDFYFDLYHARLKWKAFESGHIQLLWDGSVQNKINAISNLAPGNYDLEAHVIACQTFFRIETGAILEAMRNCLKSKTENMNRDQFTMCLFNRLTLNTKK